MQDKFANACDVSLEGSVIPVRRSEIPNADLPDNLFEPGKWVQAVGRSSVFVPDQLTQHQSRSGSNVG